MVYLVYVERNGRIYGYLAKSFRVGAKVVQKKMFYGSLSWGNENHPASLGLKDLIWLLKGTEGISWVRPEERDKWARQSDWPRLAPLCKITVGENGTPISHDEVRGMIHSLVRKLGFAHCALCYIVKHGIPTHFKPVFDEYGITEELMKATNRLAEAASKPGFVPSALNEYCQGKPEEYERMRQFLKEDPETQMKPKQNGARLEVIKQDE